MISYSNSKKDLGNVKEYSEFLSALKNVFYQSHTILKNGGYMVVVLQNLRMRNGYFCTLAWDLVKELEDKYGVKILGASSGSVDTEPEGELVGAGERTGKGSS